MINVERMLFDVLDINYKTDSLGELSLGYKLSTKADMWHALYKRKLAIEFLLEHHDKVATLTKIAEELRMDEKQFNEKYKEEQDDD